MRNLLALVGLVVVVFAGVGWYRGWYSFAVSPGADGKQRITVDVDTNKLTTDARTGASRVGEAIDGLKEKANAISPPPTPTPASAQQPAAGLVGPAGLGK